MKKLFLAISKNNMASADNNPFGALASTNPDPVLDYEDSEARGSTRAREGDHDEEVLRAGALPPPPSGAVQAMQAAASQMPLPGPAMRLADLAAQHGSWGYPTLDAQRFAAPQYAGYMPMPSTSMPMPPIHASHPCMPPMHASHAHSHARLITPPGATLPLP